MTKGKAKRPPPSDDKEERAQRFFVRREILTIVKWAVWIAVSTLPIWVIVDGFKAAAGKETKINIGLTLTLVGGGFASIAKIVMDQKKLKGQSSELTQLRSRCHDLEQKARTKERQ